MKPKYTEYRNRFLQSAKANGLEIKSSLISGHGPNKEELFQDYVYFNNNSPITVVHLAGLHGIEGYLGSDIQSEILNVWKNYQVQCNVIFVHAVNPYGMAWHRRVNANNVDLNRNSTNHLLQTQKPDEFLPFLSFLSVKSGIDFFIHWPQALLAALIKGPRKSSHIIASGQYKYSQSLFYGGSNLQYELQNLKTTISELFPSTRRWIFIDVHSGLGPKAFDSLIVTGEDTAEVHFFAQTLDRDHIVDLSKSTNFYKATGLLEDLMRTAFLKNSVYYVTQEFGTVPFYRVITNLILENSWFLNGKEKDQKRIQLSLSTFYPNDQIWNKECVRLGLERFFKIIQHCGS